MLPFIDRYADVNVQKSWFWIIEAASCDKNAGGRPALFLGVHQNSKWGCPI